MFKNDPCYVVTKINNEEITIEQNVGCYTHQLKLQKEKIRIL